MKKFQLKKLIRNIALLLVLCVVVLSNTGSSIASAGTICMIKIPLNAHLSVKGVMQNDSKIVKTEAISGRIHEIAMAVTGNTYGYKQYMISNLSSPDEVVVYDANMMPIYPTYANEGIIDYTGAAPDYVQTVYNRVLEAAIAYDNRTSGVGSNTALAKYFLKNSDAYTKAVNSDSGRKWGQPVKSAAIESVVVSEIYPYSATAFTAKATVKHYEMNGYVENYDIYMLFEHTGTDFYVTYFTYMP
ncbi:MAG: hypothetical protein IJ326_03400 [Lachnospiraceae bacterium]|nr:hypothetical protein [Lachnospiraceae bacterium]